MSSTELPPLVARNVCRRFPTPTGDVDAVVDVSFEAEAARFTVVSGPSGSGKSTLLMILAAVDRCDTGSVAVGGIDITLLSTTARRRWRRRHVGLVLPRPTDNLTTRLDTIGNLEWAARLRTARDWSTEQLDPLLDEMGLADRRHQRVGALSGGEQMRLAFACATVGSPDLVVADEPTASLDRATALRLVATIRDLTEAGRTVVVATHDPALVDAADSVVTLDRGRRVS